MHDRTWNDIDLDVSSAIAIMERTVRDTVAGLVGAMKEKMLKMPSEKLYKETNVSMNYGEIGVWNRACDRAHAALIAKSEELLGRADEKL